MFMLFFSIRKRLLVFQDTVLPFIVSIIDLSNDLTSDGTSSRVDFIAINLESRDDVMFSDGDAIAMGLLI